MAQNSVPKRAATKLKEAEALKKARIESAEASHAAASAKNRGNIMRTIPEEVHSVMQNYDGINGEVKRNLQKMLMTGHLAGTGKMLILPVDQGFEHGPTRSFAKNPDAYDPHYHFKMAIDCGFSAFAAPLGMLQTGGKTFKDKIPTILKLNSSNMLKKEDANAKDQAITATVEDAVRLGCSGVGFTLYAGSAKCDEQLEELRDIRIKAEAAGLVLFVWAYPRGGNATITAESTENALEITQYAVHMAALAGAHVIKTKLPSVEVCSDAGIEMHEKTKAIKAIKQSAFNGRRLVIFSGGEAKTMAHVVHDAQSISEADGGGMIVGRNMFQRPYKDAELLASATMLALNGVKPDINLYNSINAGSSLVNEGEISQILQQYVQKAQKIS